MQSDSDVKASNDINDSMFWHWCNTGLFPITSATVLLLLDRKLLLFIRAA